jgi:hypothetical protein
MLCVYILYIFISSIKILIKEILNNIKNARDNGNGNNFWLIFIPKKWPSLIFFVLGTISTMLAIIIFKNIIDFDDNVRLLATPDSEGLILSTICFFIILVIPAICFFFFCIVLRNLEFKDFIKKETYLRNLDNIFYCFIDMLIILFSVLYFMSYFLKTTYH